MPLNRSCDGCTKCCEGHLSGEVEGKSFYPGKLCHCIAIGSGCSIYAKRPKEPCVSYKCGWITDDTLPMWMKPSEIDAIIDRRITDSEISYWSINEAGSKLDASVLTWMIEHCLGTGQNLLWIVDGGKHWIGSPDFNQAMSLTVAV